MNKDKPDGLRKEYRPEDPGAGQRGRYLESYRSGTNLVLLSPDIARVFPDDAAVNDALRSLINIARKTTGTTKRSGRNVKG